ncbi:hypothetical protein [Acinetobacter pittii]|uniref:hypothetical protein n=1 Tax=Acinetobacter pittii TaxID=48296 RepID=UPI00094D5453|nr:hypothetical protein [Acinetobacter pittii]
MSKAMKWIGRNLSLGGLVRHAGNGLGTVTNVTVQGVGMVASALSDDPKTKKSIKDACSNVGKTLDSSITKGSAVAGQGIDYGVQKASVGIGYASGGAAKLLGASEENVILAKKVGTVVGAVSIGVIAGGGVADAAIAIGAASGTAGAAATTSGLAALGGGSIAAGGGGMAVGQAVVNAIVATGGVSGAATVKENN